MSMEFEELSLEEIRALVTRVEVDPNLIGYELAGVKGRLFSPFLDSPDDVWTGMDLSLKHDPDALVYRVAKTLNNLGVRKL